MVMFLVDTYFRVDDGRISYKNINATFHIDVDEIQWSITVVKT
jgi:hypothetical protein